MEILNGILQTGLMRKLSIRLNIQQATKELISPIPQSLRLKEILISATTFNPIKARQ
jgi:hypothetical protein